MRMSNFKLTNWKCCCSVATFQNISFPVALAFPIVEIHIHILAQTFYVFDTLLPFIYNNIRETRL